MNDRDKAIIDSLERRFQAIRDHRHKDEVLTLRVAYAQFIGTTPLLGNGLKKVILANKIPKHILFTFFMEYTLASNNEDNSRNKIKTPLFWDEEVEKKFHVYRELYEAAKTGLEESKAIKRGEMIDPILSYVEGEVANDTQSYYTIHTELMEALALNEEPESNIIAVEFVEGESDFRINKVKVTIRRFSDQYHFLRIVLNQWKNERHELFFSEIAETIDFASRRKDKKYYNAAYQIRAKIEAKTGIRDIFITTRQTIKLNPKYHYEINLS